MSILATLVLFDLSSPGLVAGLKTGHGINLGLGLTQMGGSVEPFASDRNQRPTFNDAEIPELIQSQL